MEDEFETRGEKPAVKTSKIKGKFFTREYDGNWRMMIDSDDTNADAEKIKDFFNEVPEPTKDED